MRRMLVAAVAFCVVCVAGMAAWAWGDEQNNPKYTIKEVMQMANKEGLMNKVASGRGDKADAEKLLELYQALAENKPPKGDQASWDAKTKALVDAAQEAVEGKAGFGPKLRRASNCAACHNVHRPAAE